jgi:hypothetical protein
MTTGFSGAPLPAAPMVDGRPTAGWRRWRSRVWARLASDLAVHGLAYLGVLLLFAGLFGFVTFSFAQVRAGLRPVAEAAIPVVVFGAARLLSARGSRVPAAALTVVGGLLLPVVWLAALVDDAPLPPDPSGRALVAGLAGGCLVSAAGYGTIAARRPDHPLRYVAAPAGWLAVAMAALAARRPVPGGQGIATPSGGQLAAVLAAIAITLLVVRRFPGWARPVSDAAIVGLGVTGLLAVLTLAAAGWPAVPVAVCGAAGLLALDLLDRRLPGWVVTIGQAAVLLITTLTVAASFDGHAGAAWTAAAGTLAALLLTERAGRRHATVAGPGAPLGVAAVLLLTAVGQPWPAVVACLAGAGWAFVRRHRPAPWAPPRGALATVAAVLPFGAGVALSQALGGEPGVLIDAAAVLAVAALVDAFDRGRDPFWRIWLPAAATGVLSGAAGLPPTGFAVLAAATATLSYALSPAGPAVRVWMATVGLLVTGGIAAASWQVSPDYWVYAAAGAGLAAVAAAVAVAGHRAAGHLGLAGHAVQLAACVVALNQAGDTAGTITLAAALLGFVVTAVGQEAGRAAVPDLVLAALGPVQPGGADVVCRLPAMMAAALGPFVLGRILADTGAVAYGEPWWPAPLAGLALGYAATARVVRRRTRWVTPALTAVGLVLAVLVTATAITTAGAYWVVGRQVVSAAWACAVAAAAILGATWLLRTPVLAIAPALLALTAGAVSGRDWLAVALVLVAGQLLPVSVWARRPGLTLAVPPTLCLAWLLWASGALNGDVQWFTLPVGVTLLATASRWRGILRGKHLPVGRVELVGVEITGMALMVAPACLQTIFDSIGYGFLAAAIGVALAVWGMATRVLHRLVVGAVATVGGLVLLVFVPLVPLLPQWHAAMAWLALAVAGLATVLAATVLDTARRTVRRGTARLADLTAGWE